MGWASLRWPRVGLFTGQRALHAFEQPHRPKIDVLLKLTPNRNQQSPQGHVVQHRWETDRAKKYRIERRQLFNTIRRHHCAGFEITLATPVEMLEIKGDIEARSDGFKHLETFGHDFDADPVTRDYCYAM